MFLLGTVLRQFACDLILIRNTCVQDLHGDVVRVVRRRTRRAAPAALQAIDPVENYQRFYHARTAVQMKREEVAAIMANPHKAPDSDDEENLEEWKVISPACRCQVKRQVMHALQCMKQIMNGSAHRKLVLSLGLIE